MSSSAPPTVETTEEPQSDGSKFRTLIGILRKYVNSFLHFALPLPRFSLSYRHFLAPPPALLARWRSAILRLGDIGDRDLARLAL
jgi:oxysterol-binding protein-related protein 9/10/11